MCVGHGLEDSTLTDVFQVWLTLLFVQPLRRESCAVRQRAGELTSTDRGVLAQQQADQLETPDHGGTNVHRELHVDRAVDGQHHGFGNPRVGVVLGLSIGVLYRW